MKENSYKQWIADLYHCSESWGETMTTEDMTALLQETEKQKFPGEYSPALALAAACAEYWNKLCKLYPC